MIFNSAIFFVFFAGVITIYYIVGKRVQNLLLLVASYMFYGYWDYRFLSLIFFSTVLDYVCGIKIDKADKQGTRKIFLIFSIIGNLGVLGFFKYYNFFIDTCKWCLQSFGASGEFHSLNIILPVGISFYTFQTLSYTIDIYRGNLKPTYHFFDFALFVSFFPQLVAGPIERAVNLLPQITQKRKVDASCFRTGLELFLLGMFKKVVIADTVGVLFVDKAFANPETFSGVSLALATIMFSFQIYCDFSGYSDMAIGMSKLLGIELMTNFNQPYFSASFQDFWRRWHISLSTWFRDYVYFPLGGSRLGMKRTYINIMATMLLCGLWHGAQWTFVVWGGIHGVLLCIERAFKKAVDLPESITNSVFWVVGSTFLVFGAVTFVWVFFRSENLEMAAMVLSRIFSMQEGIGFSGYIVMILCAIGIMAVDIPQRIYRNHTFFVNTPAWLNHIYYTSLLVALLMVPLSNTPFIYFQF